MVIVVAVSLSLVSCSANQEDSRRAPGENVALSALPTSSERIELESTEQKLIAGCMSRHGFQYWAVPDPVVVYPYVITDSRWARENGLSPVASPPGATGKRNDKYIGELGTQKDAYFTTLLGDPNTSSVSTPVPSGGVLGHAANGCQAEAVEDLYGNYQEWFVAHSIMADLEPIWETQVRHDPAFTQAASDWSRCMRTKGFSYSSPAAATAAYAQRAPATEPGEKEVLVAAAEVGCARTTAIAAVAANLEQKYSTTLRRKYVTYANQEANLIKNAVARARTNS
jgi:hypothetical protein